MGGETGKKIVEVEGELSVPETVRYPSFESAQLRDVNEDAWDREPVEVEAELFLPQGPRENRAAMVIVQGLGSQKPEWELAYGHKLAKAGVVALSIDSFRSCGLADADDERKALQATT